MHQAAVKPFLINELWSKCNLKGAYLIAGMLKHIKYKRKILQVAFRFQLFHHYY